MAATSHAATAYAALTSGCALVDRSDRGKLALTGTQAKTFLQGQISNDVEALEPGTGCYAALLTPKGKMRGDLRVLDLGGELSLDTERVALQELFNTIRHFKLGYDVELHKRTLERGLVSLIGPRARAVAGVDVPRAEHASTTGQVGDVAVTAVATAAGGVDLICDATDTDALIATLAGRGAVAVDEAEADVVRVEHGVPRYGVDLDDTVIPQEAGLNARAVSFTKGCYVGQETVARLFYRGKPNRELRGLRLSAPVAAGAELRRGEKVVGRVTSVVDSPRMGSIGLALVRREAVVGEEVAAGDDGTVAVVSELPFGASPSGGPAAAV